MLKLAMEDEETIDTFKQAFNEQDEGEKDGGSSKVLSSTPLHHWKCNLHITTPVRTSRYLINPLFMVLLCFFLYHDKESSGCPLPASKLFSQKLVIVSQQD